MNQALSEKQNSGFSLSTKEVQGFNFSKKASNEIEFAIVQSKAGIFT
jgi:hypothetical protein